MSVQAIRWATKVRGLSIQEKAVLFVLADAHNGKTGKCFPSQSVIADGAGMTPKTARKFIVAMEAKGLLTRTLTSYGKGLFTFYELHFEATEPNGRTLPTGPDEPNGRIVPFGRPRANGRTVPFGRAEKGGDQTVIQGGPNGNCVPFAIEEPEKEPEVVPSHDADASFEGRDGDLFDHLTASQQTIPNTNTQVATKRELLSEIIFKIGKPLLARDGLTPTQAGAFLGKLIKNSNLEIVAKIVSQAAQIMPVDARGWITKGVRKECDRVGLKPAKGPPPPIDWPAIVERWFDTGAWPQRAGDKPIEDGYRGPLELIEKLLPRYDANHPHAHQIRRTLEARKQRA